MNATHTLPEILSATQVADLLNLNRKTVYEQAKIGKLPFMRRVGRKWIAHRDSVLTWVRADLSHDRSNNHVSA